MDIQINKKIDIKEFVEKGYLQELNRSFLHPLGLALMVNINETKYSLEYVEDCRDEDEGFYFGFKDRSNLDESIRKKESIENLWNERIANREEKLGFMIEPIE